MRRPFLTDYRFLVLVLVLSSTTALLTGCVGLAATPAAPTVTFAAAPTTITAGASTTLTWTSANAANATINSGVGTVPPSGTMKVSPTQTTTYTITVQGSGTETATAQVTVTVRPLNAPTVTISASPTSIVAGQSTTLTVVATNSNKVVITDNVDSNSFPVSASGGTQVVTPTATTIYTATATGAVNPPATATVTVTVTPGSLNLSVNHIIFMMQENRTFDHYFGMLNPYRAANGYNVGDDGVTYNVDGIDDKLSTFNVNDEGQSFSLFKLKSTCIDDDSSAWLPSYGDVSRYDFSLTRPINMDGFVHTAEGYAKFCANPANGCTGGQFTDLVGQRTMGYYDETYLNYYYYMASQFALSDRWFSPVSSESTPNRIATMTGGTTQGLVWDPGHDDHLGQLPIQTIFQELDGAAVSWKIYYSTTQDNCTVGDNTCGAGVSLGKMPSTTFTAFTYSTKYVYPNKSKAACTPPTQNSGTAVGDPNNDFCIDTSHITPIAQFNTDLTNKTLPSFAWVEPGYSHNDEHPGSGQSILFGQAQVASLFNAFMGSPSWHDSIFFWSYDEGGGPYDHVPPVPTFTNKNTDPSLGITTDISSIAVNPDTYFPCALVAGSFHCDLRPTDPGINSSDAPAQQGFAAQLGFRLPNIILSPFTRRHYVSHIPMDHTAIIKLVETRFLNGASLTKRDAAQPDLLDFFDFTRVPWVTPPSGVPQPFDPAQGPATCTPDNM